MTCEDADGLLECSLGLGALGVGSRADPDWVKGVFEVSLRADLHRAVVAENDYSVVPGPIPFASVSDCTGIDVAGSLDELDPDLLHKPEPRKKEAGAPMVDKSLKEALRVVHKAVADYATCALR